MTWTGRGLPRVLTRVAVGGQVDFISRERYDVDKRRAWTKSKRIALDWRGRWHLYETNNQDDVTTTFNQNDAVLFAAGVTR